MKGQAPLGNMLGMVRSVEGERLVEEVKGGERVVLFPWWWWVGRVERVGSSGNSNRV